MRMRYHSDNGAPCWRCDGTIYTYTVDDAVTYVMAVCLGCGRDNTFHPPANCNGCDSPRAVSLAHRESHCPTQQ
jgi:hypothetical protein